MIFNDSKSITSTKYPLNWGVDYVDGTYMKEFNEDGSQNDYYSIDVNNINRFGLFNHGVKLFYQKDGSFLLNGQLIQIEYHVDNEIYYLTTSSKHKDCISYKQVSMIPSGRGVQKTTMEGICFGYKTIIENNDTQIYFKPIVTSPLIGDGKVFITVQLTSNKDLNGKLVFKNKHKVIEEFTAPLKQNYAGIIDWVVK